jgi:DNA-binding response OmpR family regulator
MPEIDGFGMIHTLRANPLYASMPIIVISGLDAAALKAGGLPRDIPSFSKPVPFDELYAAFSLLLKNEALPVPTPALKTAQP